MAFSPSWINGKEFIRYWGDLFPMWNKVEMFPEIVWLSLFQVSDAGVCLAQSQKYTPGSDGEVTINFLFTLGAQCLAKWVKMYC